MMSSSILNMPGAYTKVTIAIDSLGNIVWICPLHEYVRVLLHLRQFLIRRQVRYPPYSPWEHVPAHVWTAPTQEDNDDEDVVGDDGDVCALCCTKSDPEKMSMCDKCKLQYCTDCIDTHTHTHTHTHVTM